MLNPEHFITSFARTVELFRTMPDAVPEQKAALRALLALSKLGTVSIHFDGAHLTVLDAAVSTSLPSVPALLVQLREHGVSSIEIDQDAAPAELLKLVRRLAGRAGQGPAMADGTSVRVTARTVPPASEAAPPTSAAMEAAVAPPKEEAPAPAPAEERKPPEPLAVIHNDEEFTGALNDLRSFPYEGSVLNRISPLAAYVTKQLEHDKLEQAVSALATFVDLEEKAPDEDGRRPYGIVLGRLLQQGRALEALGEMLLDRRHAEDAARVLGRAGPAAYESLLKRLENASDTQEAEAYVRVLEPIVDDVRPMLSLLSSQRWCVALSVAELMGRLARGEAVPALGGAMEHADSRVRHAAVNALAKIGTPPATEHLLRAVASEDEALRSGVTGGVSGRRSSALAMPILKVAEGEDVHPEVQRDCYFALGRIGTPDAVRALIKAAEPGGRVLARKSSVQRVAAVKGLGETADQKALSMLEGLVNDRDKAVRQAAAVAVAAVRQKLTAGETP